MSEEESDRSEIIGDPVFKRVLKDALEIQDRFAAEPVFHNTGKGYLKSDGVIALRELKKNQKVRESSEDPD